MARKVILVLSMVLIMALIVACGEAADDVAGDKTGTYTDFIDTGKIIGIQSGTAYNDVAWHMFKAKDVPEYTFMTELFEDVRKGRVDAALTETTFIQNLQDSGMFTDLDYILVDKDFYVNRSAPVFHTTELRDKYNEWLATIKADGTLAQLTDFWLGSSLPAQEDLPKFELTGENGTLRVCDTGNFPPLTYFDENNDPTGFDFDIISRFAQHLGMDVEITMLAYDAIIPYVISGRADMSACYFTITEERSESVIFGDAIIETQAVLVVPGGLVPEAAPAVRSHTEFAGKDIAVITGVLTYNTTQKIGANPIEYNDSASAAEEVRKGRVAGYMHALTAVQVMAAQLDGFDAIPVPKEIFSAQIGGISHDQAVIDRFNNFLIAITDDGTLDEMQNRWFGGVIDLDMPLPEIPNPGTNGTIHVAICSDSIPYVYVSENGDYSGYSIELALRFGAYEGKNVEFTDMEFGGLIPYIVSGRADIALANIAITEERKQSVLFTEPFFDEQHGILALKRDGDHPAAAAAQLTFDDFIGKQVGAVTGNLSGEVITEYLNNDPVYYSEQSAGIEDVRRGRIDGFMTDLSILRVIATSPGFEDTQVIPVPAEIFAGPLGAMSMDQDIIDRFNLFLAQLEADGTLADMQNRWLDNVPDLDSLMPDIPLTGENGTLTVATSGLQLPFSYFGANNELKGYSIELAVRFAAHEGMDIVFVSMDFAGLIPYVTAGRADFAIDAVTITEERKQSVLFTDSIYDDLLGIITLKPDTANVAGLSYSDFAGRRIGVEPGAVFGQIAEEINAEPVYYNDMAAGIEDLRRLRIDGFMADKNTARVFTATQDNDDLQIIDVPAEIFAAHMGAISMSQEMIDRFNVFLAGIEADGTLSVMQDYWLDGVPDLAAPMPEIPLTGENGTIIVATSGLAMPYTYFGDNNELKGFCVELALRFGAHEGMDIEFHTVDFAGMIPYVVSERANIGIDPLYITEERKQSVLFSEPFAADYIAILALKDFESESAAAGSGGGFGEWLRTGIERNLITDNRWMMVVNGLSVTMTISFFSQIFGTLFGFFICWVLLRKNKIVKWFGNFYCGLIHGTPIVVLLMITYYIIFGNTRISNVVIAIAAFTLVMGANVAQNLKGAIDTIDPVEIEAARSIGFPAWRAFLTVTFPQAVRRALPGYTNGFVELVKATAIVGYIAIQDLTRAGDIIRSRTYDAYFPLLFIAVIYLIVTTICVQLFKVIVRKVNGGIPQ